MHDTSPTKMAISATLHCLFGCAIGEVMGLVIGTAMGLSNLLTLGISIALAFVTGYTLSTFPLVESLGIKRALLTVLAADTLSILTMEIVDSFVEATIPGAMNAGLANPLFWLTMPLSLGAAFLVAVPVNRYLLMRGKGHALVHKYHGDSHS